jgi:single-strand DNA-binding protein
VEGSLRTRTYDDDKGNRRYFTEIRAQTIQLLGRREEAPEAAPEVPEVPPEGEDDIPF